MVALPIVLPIRPAWDYYSHPTVRHYHGHGLPWLGWGAKMGGEGRYHRDFARNIKQGLSFSWPFAIFVSDHVIQNT